MINQRLDGRVAVVTGASKGLGKQMAEALAEAGATVALVACLFLFTAVYLMVGVVVGASYGFGFGLIAAVGAPVCGYLTVGMAERLRRVTRAVAGYRSARRGDADMAALRAQRTVVVGAASALIGAVALGGPTTDP